MTRFVSIRWVESDSFLVRSINILKTFEDQENHNNGEVLDVHLAYVYIYIYIRVCIYIYI